MPEVHMGIADNRHLWAEVDRLKTQVQELRAANRLAQEERARTSELLVSVVTRAQLDAALSTKVSLALVDAQLIAVRSEMRTHLEQKADLTSLVTLQSSKLDVSVFEANAWDLNKFRTAMEQHVRDLFATFAAQVESQVSMKLGIEDFNRVFNPEETGQKATLETAALRISKMTDQLESLSNYMSGDRQRQRQVAELNVNMLDLTRKQTVTRNSIVQLESVEQVTTAQLRVLDEQTNQVIANLQSLTATLSGLQSQTQTDKNAQDARQARLLHNMKQLETRTQHLVKTLSDLNEFAHSGLVDAIDAKLKTNDEKLQKDLTKTNTTSGLHTQQLNQRMNKINDTLLQHKEHLAQLDACMRKLAGVLRETRGELNDVKGPLATLVTNLHEENVAILQEIERSQDGTRNIMLDYQDLLEREKISQVFVSLPSRPSSNGFCNSTEASRKHKQKMLLATKATNRPHTSSPRVGTGSTRNGSLPVGVSRSAGPVRSISPSTPLRPQTTRTIPLVLENLGLTNNDLNAKLKDEIPGKEVRTTAPVTIKQTSLRGQMIKHEPSIFRRVSGNGDEDLFHFPDRGEV